MTAGARECMPRRRSEARVLRRGPGHEAVVIGMGAFSPLGRNCIEMRQALLESRDSIAKVTHFDACRFIGELASSFGDDVPV